MPQATPEMYLRIEVGGYEETPDLSDIRFHYDIYQDQALIHRVTIVATTGRIMIDGDEKTARVFENEQQVGDIFVDLMSAAEARFIESL